MPNSKEYWRKREEKAIQERMKNDAIESRKLKQLYERTRANIELQIKAFYESYARIQNITYADAVKAVSEHNVRDFQAKAKEYVRTKDFSTTANKELRLYNATMRINRLELLKANIGLELVALSNERDSLLLKYLESGAYEEFERQAGILGDSILNNANNIQSIVNASFHNATFSDRIWGNSKVFHAKLTELLTSSLVQGKHPNKLAEELRQMFQSSLYEAERLMRTESARVQSAAQKDSFDRNGIDEFEFIAEPGACRRCAILNSKTFKVSEMMPGENSAPMHANCRCSVVAYVDRGEFLTKEKEREHKLSERMFGADLDFVKSKKFLEMVKKDDKFNHIAEQIQSVSRKILHNRNGSSIEDYYLLDYNKGKIKAISNTGNKVKGVTYNKAVRDVFASAEKASLISIHNHPSSYPPSLSDIASIQQPSKNGSVKFGLTIGHDGTMYWYSKPKHKFKKVDLELFEQLVLKFIKEGFTPVSAQEKALNIYKEKHEFNFGKVGE